ncbi:MAG: hypothetical protein MZV70_76105 [Desulfobacterales bacterium]|nr:hypothetical protein [Desulfobacterales bacterium]
MGEKWRAADTDGNASGLHRRPVQAAGARCIFPEGPPARRHRLPRAAERPAFAEADRAGARPATASGWPFSGSTTAAAAKAKGGWNEHTTLEARCSDLLHAIRHLARTRRTLEGASASSAAAWAAPVCLRAAAHADIASAGDLCRAGRSSRPLNDRRPACGRDPGRRARMAARAERGLRPRPRS